MKEYPDISSRVHIELVVHNFYSDLLADKEMNPFFTKAMTLKLSEHLPIICDFWESILLHQPVYKRNVMLKHIDLNKKMKLSKVHFEKWLALWEKNVKSNFSGPTADEAIKRAKLMGQLMEFKVRASEKDGFIQ